MNERTPSEFVGTWRLISYTSVTSTGETRYPMGQAPVGRLIYEPNGRMAVQLAGSDRTAFAVRDPEAATGEEARAALKSYLAYFGTYTFQPDPPAVVHHIEVSLFPNWTGGDLVRYYELQARRLVLRTPPSIVGGVETVTTLVWEKLP